MVNDIKNEQAQPELQWFDDGQARMAVAIPERGRWHFCSGIRPRLEGLTLRYLRGLIDVRPGDVVINFGANIGEVAVTLADRGARVVAIEPDPYVLPALNANAKSRKIAVVPFAAWNADTQLTLNLATANADTSYFQPSAERVTGQIDVSAYRIDTMLQGQNFDRIRLIVGDAEGAEPEVLEGARETLAKTDYVSVCASAERNGEVTSPACERILTDAGFEILYREKSRFYMLIGRNREVADV